MKRASADPAIPGSTASELGKSPVGLELGLNPVGWRAQSTPPKMQQPFYGGHMRKKKNALELVRIEKETYNRATGRRIRRIYERPKVDPLRVRVKKAAMMLTGVFMIAAGCLQLL